MLGDQRGFTIIEVLVAATLLVIGVLGTVAMVDSSNAETRLSGGREGATNLAREVVEGGRSLAYDEVLPASVDARLQALPGLATTTPGSWTVKRRGITYSVSTSVCSVDDPKDGYGSHAGATYCADSASTGTTDAQPDDFKRLTVDASWSRNAGTRSLRQVALIDSPASKGPRIISLVATAPVVASPAAPKITSASVTTVSFKATAPAGVASVTYSLDGTDKGQAVKAANGTDWNFDISLAALSDGGYDVSVRAVDARDVTGPTFTIPMTLIRGAPAAPSGLVGGPNTIYVNGTAQAVTELEWKANPERNVIGYRVYNESNALVCPESAQTLSLKLSCIDMANTGGTYQVAALYRNASDVVTEGPPSSIATAAARKYYFTSTTPSSATNCGAATVQREMAENFTGLNPETVYGQAGAQVNFCSAPFTAGENMGAGSAAATVYMHSATKQSSTNCVLTGQLFRNGTTTAFSTARSVTVTGQSPLQAYSLPLGTVPATTFAAGDRLNMVFTLDAAGPCKELYMHYGGTTSRSFLRVPGNVVPPPKPPTGLSATTLADGTTRLSWSAPNGGSTRASFYRIYRDGIDYTNRLDTTGETTYDDDPEGATHSYYVTSVSGDLAESTMVGPVTK